MSESNATFDTVEAFIAQIDKHLNDVKKMYHVILQRRLYVAKLKMELQVILEQANMSSKNKGEELKRKIIAMDKSADPKHSSE